MKLFEGVVGSKAYGTDLPESDRDIKGIYGQSVEDLISFNYKEQIEIGKDEVHYELRRFLQLLQTANPTMQELLWLPDDCILYTSPAFELIKENRKAFLTKKCFFTFGGFAVAQIKKAKGLNKKMNWEESKVIRKDILDFVYIYEEGKTKPIKVWLVENNMKQEYCGLVALNHFPNTYALYYDYASQYGADANTEYQTLGFKGLGDNFSNDLRVSSVPKYMTPSTIVNFNKDSYSSHCADYKSYEEWLKNRNTQRYVDIKDHGQLIDGKNMLHCMRLIETCAEIALTGKLNVRRPNAQYLIDIRKGKYSLEAILENCESNLKVLDSYYNDCDLPEDVDKEFVNDLLIQARKLYL